MLPSILTGWPETYEIEKQAGASSHPVCSLAIFEGWEGDGKKRGDKVKMYNISVESFVILKL